MCSVIKNNKMIKTVFALAILIPSQLVNSATIAFPFTWYGVYHKPYENIIINTEEDAKNYPQLEEKVLENGVHVYYFPI